jgi:FkbM family methyltransferase
MRIPGSSVAQGIVQLARTLRYISRQHPLGSRNAGLALSRWLRWQLGSRLLSASVAVPFVGPTRLLVSPGMAGATGNIYCGLHEFEEMGFLLHVLREGDLFVDVGANVGSYTVLASGVRHAHSIAFEPVPSTFAALVDNLCLNQLGPLVEAHNRAVGATQGTVRFTTELDTVNHVASDADRWDRTVEVPLTTVDAVLAERCPLLVKIDVEGFEAQVLAGMKSTLGKPGLCAVIMETNSSGRRYGGSDRELFEAMTGLGFEAFRYEPMNRRLTLAREAERSDNTLFVRNVHEIERRVVAAPAVAVLGHEV